MQGMLCVQGCRDIWTLAWQDRDRAEECCLPEGMHMPPTGSHVSGHSLGQPEG